MSPRTKFMETAVRGYHMAESNSVAVMGEALGLGPAEEWPGVVGRVCRKYDSSAIWSWAMRRWGGKVWPDAEYDLSERSANHRKNEEAANDTDLLDWADDNVDSIRVRSTANADSGDYCTFWTVYGDTANNPGNIVEIGYGDTIRRALKDAMLDDEDPRKSTYVPPEFR